jgi:hypothetical protein
MLALDLDLRRFDAEWIAVRYDVDTAVLRILGYARLVAQSAQQCGREFFELAV